MMKLILMALIVLGGFGLMSKYAPQLISATLCHIAGFTITGGLVLILVLLYAGYKCVG